MGELLNPRQYRAAREVRVELSTGDDVMARREDMTLLVFEGRVPMPMLMAVQKMIEMPNASPEERVAALGEHGRSLVETLQRHACAVVIRPTLVMEDDGNPDHLPVSYLSVADLIRIWTATAVVPTLGVVDAARFRGAAGADDAAAVPAGTDVQPAAEPVAAPAADYVGQ